MEQLFLRTKHLSKTYCSKEALVEVSLDLYKGEVLGLLGVNGAGKTTLSSILSTLHPPTSGVILWKGKSVYDDLLSYRKMVGFCPQNPNIEKRLSMEENLVFSGRCYGLTKGEALSQKEKLLKQFHLKTYARSKVDTLSGGYRQRFLIARALMHNPQFVILDEPTVGLDPHVRRQLWEVIAELHSQQITVLLTTHYLDEAETLSDRVCLIHDGKVRTVDTPTNLKKHHRKNNLEEVFLKFVDDPNAEIFNSVSTEHE
ncbi:MAG: Linearmycin resistance ATP-binding protein LnrL [Chlamydiales bacterium]|nr:Linearmycin resistance ATP-binding protein LnrL [Chlamydiales bacterium]